MKKCTFDENDYKPCELQAMDCETCDYLQEESMTVSEFNKILETVPDDFDVYVGDIHDDYNIVDIDYVSNGRKEIRLRIEVDE